MISFRSWALLLLTASSTFSTLIKAAGPCDEGETQCARTGANVNGDFRQLDLQLTQCLLAKKLCKIADFKAQGKQDLADLFTKRENFNSAEELQLDRIPAIQRGEPSFMLQSHKTLLKPFALEKYGSKFEQCERDMKPCFASVPGVADRKQRMHKFADCKCQEFLCFERQMEKPDLEHVIQAQRMTIAAQFWEHFMNAMLNPAQTCSADPNGDCLKLDGKDITAIAGHPELSTRGNSAPSPAPSPSPSPAPAPATEPGPKNIPVSGVVTSGSGDTQEVTLTLTIPKAQSIEGLRVMLL